MAVALLVAVLAVLAVATGCDGSRLVLVEAGESARIGRESAVELESVDLDGRVVRPFAAVSPPITVFCFLRTNCPIANRYAPEIRRIDDEYTPRGVRFFLVYPDADESDADVRRHIEEYGHQTPVLRDPQHRLVRFCGATVTPEVAVVAAGGELVYRGRIDDRYVDFGQARPVATRHDLRDALDVALSGESRKTIVTPAVGCPISPR